MKKILILLGAVALLAGCNHKKEAALTASGLNPENFIDTFNDAPTALYTLSNANGMEVCITNFGGRIVSILVPDNQGQKDHPGRQGVPAPAEQLRPLPPRRSHRLAVSGV